MHLIDFELAQIEIEIKHTTRMKKFYLYSQIAFFIMLMIETWMGIYLSASWFNGMGCGVSFFCLISAVFDYHLCKSKMACHLIRKKYWELILSQFHIEVAKLNVPAPENKTP